MIQCTGDLLIGLAKRLDFSLLSRINGSLYISRNGHGIERE